MRAAKHSPFLRMALMLLVCAVCGAQAYAAASERETEVTVSFIERIYFRVFESGGMDVDFDSQPLPLGDTVIPALDGAHTLRVFDSRLYPGHWAVTAVMSALKGGGESFDAQVHLFHIAPVDGIAFNQEGGPSGSYARVSKNPNLIMTAGSNIERGSYDLTCLAGDVRLFIDEGEARRVQPRAYEGTITWTLTISP